MSAPDHLMVICLLWFQMMTKHHPRGIFSFTLNIAPLLEIGITNQFKVHGVITEGYDVLNDHRRGHWLTGAGARYFTPAGVTDLHEGSRCCMVRWRTLSIWIRTSVFRLRHLYTCMRLGVGCSPNQFSKRFNSNIHCNIRGSLPLKIWSYRAKFCNE